jgi:hypothetical protein
MMKYLQQLRLWNFPIRAIIVHVIRAMLVGSIYSSAVSPLRWVILEVKVALHDQHAISASF